MKKLIVILTAGIFLNSANMVSAAGGGIVNLTLQDAGNGQTLFTFGVNNFISQSGLSISSTAPAKQIGSFVPIFTGWINDSEACGTAMALSSFGNFTNPYGVADHGVLSALLDSVQFMDAGEGSYAFQLNLSDALSADFGNVIYYSSGTDSGILNVPITAFNSGVYTDFEPGGYFGGNGMFDMNVNYTLTVTAPVPEPSTFALAGLGSLSLLLYRRRK